MKRFLRVIPLACTLLLLALGAFLPRLAALALDRQLEKPVVLPQAQSVSLTLEQGAELFQVLELVGGAHSQVELSEGYHMSAREAEQAVLELRGLLPSPETSYRTPLITPMLLTSRSTPGLSAVLWRCVWEGAPGAQEELWLDDRSGRMVAFAGRVEGSTLSDLGSFYPEAVSAVGEYCLRYYPVDTTELAFEREDAAAQWYTLTLRKHYDGQEQLLSVSVRLADGWLYFNE